jgi:hypothetical protein
MDTGNPATIVDRICCGGVAVSMVVAVMMVIVMMVVIVRVIMIMMVAVMRMRMGMAVTVIAMMVVMIVTVRLGLRTRLDAALLITATANRTHQPTSSSLTRISSPAVTCT